MKFKEPEKLNTLLVILQHGGDSDTHLFDLSRAIDIKIYICI